MKRFRLALLVGVTAAVLQAGSAHGQTTYTWTGGGTGGWGNPASWGELSPVTLNANTSVIFYATGTTRLSSQVGAISTIGTLTFDDNADSDVIIRLSNSVDGAVVPLTMGNATIAPTINVTSGASGNHSIGTNRTGSGTYGDLILGGNLTVTHSGTGTLTIDRPVTGTGFGITKNGTGTLILSAANTYTGATAVTGGTLAIASTGNINSSSGVTINGGELNYNGSSPLTSALTLTAGTISGSGTVNSALTIGPGTTLSPGNSPGIQVFGANQTWATGGNFNWQVLDAAGSAGTGFDQIQITGTLNVQSGFNLNLWSLASIGPDVSGNATGFNSSSNYTWTIATTTGGVLNSGNLTSAVINVGAFNGTDGFTNGLGVGSFNLSADANNVYLNFVAVPEPSTCALLGGAVLGIVAYQRRRTCRRP
jgi:autotransporter-associated beta strand protein